MPENKTQMTGALRLAGLRAERDQIREEQPGAQRAGVHPRSDVFFLLDTIALMETIIEAISASQLEGGSDDV